MREPDYLPHSNLFYYLYRYNNGFLEINELCHPRGLPPYLGEEVWSLQLAGELCWRERKLLVAPHMPDRSKNRSQTLCGPWSSRLVFGRVFSNRTLEESTVANPPEPVEKNRGWGRRTRRVVAPVKRRNKKWALYNYCVNRNVYNLRTPASFSKTLFTSEIL
jgi:hypothetical protein